ncbi:hypothetical protein Tco_1466298 [Tanacetum coccineum]
MANKHSIMTREMVESFCNSYYIPDEVHPTAPGRDRTITQFPEGKVGVYTRLFDYCGYRIPFTKFFVAVLKHFRIHISQLSPFGAARVSHFEVLTRVLNLAPSVAVFRAFYTRIYSDGLFSFAKRSLSAPSCLSKPPDSIKNWADHFFWVDSKVFPISVPLYMGGVLEKDPAPHLTARQEQAVQVLSTNKAPFRRYPECFLVLVGLSPYYPFDENTYPAFERPDKTEMGLLDYIRTADPRKVQAVEVQKGEEQVKLLDSIKHCFVSLDTPAVAQQEGGSGSGAGPEVSAPAAEENVVAEENIVSVGTYLDLTDPEDDLTVAEKGDTTQKQSEKAKRKKLSKQSDTLPAKRLRVDHPSLASGTGGKTLASLRRTIPEGSLALGPSFQADVHAQVTVRSSRVADAPVYTAADTVTSSRGKTLAAPTSDVGGSSQPETSEGSADSFYETAALNSEDAKRWLLLRRRDVEIARVAVSQKETDISLLDSRATYLKSALDDSQAACTEAKNLISTLSSERDGLASEVSTLYSAFRDFKEKMEAQQNAGPGKIPGWMRSWIAFSWTGLWQTSLKLLIFNRALSSSPSLSIMLMLRLLSGTSLSFALLNVHTRAEGAKKHAAALRQLMVDIISHPLSSQNLVGEASTSAATLSVEDLDTDEDLGSVVCMPQFEDPRFEILP